MAKNKAQTLAMLQAAKNLRQSIRAYLAGDFTTYFDAYSTALAAGSDAPEDAEQLTAMETLFKDAERLDTDAVALFRSLHKTLGRYAGSANLSEEARNIEAFSAKLIADSEAVLLRGYTKASSWSVGSGNVGNGDAVLLATGVGGRVRDIAHVQTITALCLRSSFEGAQLGREEWEISGQDLGARPWAERGSKGAGFYAPSLDQSIRDWGDGVPRLTQDPAKYTSWGVNTQPVITNGSFEETAGTGVDLVAGALISAGDSNLTLVAGGVFGSQCLNATGDFVLAWPLTAGRLRTRGAYAIRCHVYVEAGVTDGDITLKLKDDSTDHGTITIDTTGLTDATWTKATPVAFVIPAALGANPRLELELDDYAGSGDVRIDAVMLVPMTLLDGGYAFAFLEGTTAFRKDDTFTIATTVSEAGGIQRCATEAWRRPIHAASPAVTWAES